MIILELILILNSQHPKLNVALFSQALDMSLVNVRQKIMMNLRLMLTGIKIL